MALTPETTLPSHESLLVDYLRRLEGHRKGRRALHVHVSDLKPDNRRQQHINVAVNTFDPLVRQGLGQVFLLANSDIIFIFQTDIAEDVDAIIVKLRFMFSDDPLLMDELDGLPSRFFSWHDLTVEYDKILQMAQKMQAEEQRRRAREQPLTTAMGGGGAAGKRQLGDPLTPEVLGKVVDALTRADMSNLLRRQSICAIVGKARPQPMFVELFVSIADLRETLIPNINLASSPWLFQHLTETLDRRVLSALNKHDDRTLSGDVSVNLNVSTILSPEFLKFDDSIKAGARGTIVLELQKTDIFADLGAYLFARDFAHERGFRICIDGLTHAMLPFVNRERLGADLVKLVWDDSLAELIKSKDAPEAKALGDLIRRRGPSRTILCRCDTDEAIQLGQSLGLTMFQGRQVENILAAETRSRTSMARGKRR